MIFQDRTYLREKPDAFPEDKSGPEKSRRHPHCVLVPVVMPPATAQMMMKVFASLPINRKLMYSGSGNTGTLQSTF